MGSLMNKCEICLESKWSSPVKKKLNINKISYQNATIHTVITKALINRFVYGDIRIVIFGSVDPVVG